MYLLVLNADLLSKFCLYSVSGISLVCRPFFAIASEDDGLDGQDEEMSSHINWVDR